MIVSRKKLALSGEASTSSQPSILTTEDDAHFYQSDSDYHLVRMSCLKMAVSVFSCCDSPLAVTEEMQSRRGLVSYVSICCTVCGKKSLVTDPYCEEDLAVNSRFIRGMRVIGKGRAAMESLTNHGHAPSTLQATLFQPHKSYSCRFYSRESGPVFICCSSPLETCQG